MAYAGAATSLVQQGRLRVPTGAWDRPDSTSALSLWPPGYPVAIAVPVYFGVTPIQSGRWINIVAAAVSAATVVFVIGAAVGLPAGIAGALVLFATQAFFDAHLSVLSEPMFIALMLLVLAAMVFARDRLLLLGLLASACVMVRYAGAAVPAAVVTWTLMDSRYNPGRRIRRAALVALLPGAALLVWLARTAAAPDRHATPGVSVYGDWGVTLHQARDTFARWLAPLMPDGVMQQVIAVSAGIALLVFVIAAASDTSGNRLRQQRIGRVATILGAATIIALWYAIVVLASRAFVGGTIPFDWRILAPLIVLFEVMAVTAIGYWWRAYHLPLHITVGVVALAWLAAAGTATVNDAVYAASEGSDFAARSWRKSPLIAWVRQHGAGHTLYSNWPPALYFHAGRVAREFPDSTDPNDIEGFAQRLRSNHGYVVGFDTRSPDFISPTSLARQLGLREVARVADGSVWTSDTTASSLSPAPSVPTDSIRAASMARVSSVTDTADTAVTAVTARAVPPRRR